MSEAALQPDQAVDRLHLGQTAVLAHECEAACGAALRRLSARPSTGPGLSPRGATASRCQTDYDADGNVIRITIHAKTQDRIFLEGSDKVVVGHANYHVFTLAPGAGLYEGVEKWTGVFWHVVVPGLGTVLVDVGLEIIDWKLLYEGYSPVLKAVGKHQWMEADFDKLCTALR